MAVDGAVAEVRTEGGETRLPWAIPVAFVSAWGLVALAEFSGVGHNFTHDAVLGTSTAPVGLALFLVGWLVMVAAMMLPATVPAVRGLMVRSGQYGGKLAGPFLGGFAVVWAAAGVAALSLDAMVHESVAGIPALAARPELVGAAVLMAAGTVQLALSTGGILSVPAGRAPSLGPGGRATFTAGTEQGVRSLRSDGPLMLVMFAIGTGVVPMVVLTAVMAAERSPAFGRRVAVATGYLLLVGGALTALHPAWFPSPFVIR